MSKEITIYINETTKLIYEPGLGTAPEYVCITHYNSETRGWKSQGLIHLGKCNIEEALAAFERLGKLLVLK